MKIKSVVLILSTVVSHLSTIPDKGEVLISPYSVFIVTKRETIFYPEQNNAQRIEIELEEYDETQIKFNCYLTLN